MTTSTFRRNVLGFAVAALMLSMTVALPGALAQQRGSDPEHTLDLTWDRWLDHDEIGERMQLMAETWPEFLDLQSVGSSYGGREMWLMTINNPETGPEDSKAAMMIEANVHGNEIQGAEVILYTIWYLMENYGRVDDVTRLVDERVFYLAPSVNPDGRDYFLDGTGSGARTGHVPVDSDGDGAFDEDGPNDLNGNGVIEQIRKFTPGEGTHRPSVLDPRIMERVPPDEVGDWVLLGSEGIDDDGDGRVNEDPVGGYDPNRNYASDWQPNYIQGGSMNYPFELPEARAINDFMMVRPNIAGFQSYHNTGGMILRGPGAAWFGDYPQSDLRVYDEIGEFGERMLPYYDYLVIWRGLYTVHGGSDRLGQRRVGDHQLLQRAVERRAVLQQPAPAGAAAGSEPADQRGAIALFLRRFPRARRPVRRVGTLRPSAVRRRRDGRFQETQWPGEPPLHEHGAIPPQHGVHPLPRRHDAADVDGGELGRTHRRRRVPGASRHHQRTADPDHHRPCAGEQRRAPGPDYGRGRRRDHCGGVGRRQVPPRADAADRSGRAGSHPGAQRSTRDGLRERSSIWCAAAAR